MSKRKLKAIATQLRNGILGKRGSDGMCFAICAALQSYLSACGYETVLEEADFRTTNHYWLRLQDGNILDPTADQFSGPTLKLPRVYLGPVPEIYQRWQGETK